MNGNGSLNVAIATGAALASGASFAVASVLQQRAARSAPPGDALRPRLIFDLLHRSIWLVGAAMGGVGFGFQALALYFGAITLVQPLLLSDLLFALPLAAWMAGTRLGKVEWTGAGLVAGGLAMFLGVASPTPGHARLGVASWLAVIGTMVAVIAAALLIAPRERGLLRTSMFAVGAGVSFGVMAALTKATATEFGHRGLAVIATFEPWALATVALIGLVLSQSAFQAGSLAVSLPLIDVLEPLTAGTIAVVAFQESINRSSSAVMLELLGAAAVVAGIVILDNSPLVSHSHR